MPIRTVARPPAGNVAFAPTTQPTTRGGGRRSFNVRARVGTFNFPSAPGVVNVTGIGFTPKVLIPFGSQAAVDGNTTEVNLGIGAANNRGGSGFNTFRPADEFANALWSKSRASVSANTNETAGPLGGNSADKLIEDSSASNTHYVRYIGGELLNTSQDYTFSVYVKAAGRTFVGLIWNGTSSRSAWFNLTNGTVDLVSNGTASIQDVGNGWFRCSYTTTPPTTSSSFEVYLSTGASFASASYTGNGTSGVYLELAKLEAGSTATAYSASSQAAISCSSQNAVTTTVARRIHRNTSVVSMLAGNGTLLKEASVNSLTSDGFGLNFTTASVARIFNHICLGGDIEANLVECQMNGTNAAQSFAHGLSGAPTGILIFSQLISSGASSATLVLSSLGAWAGGSQWNSMIYCLDAVTTTTTRRRLGASGVAGWITTSLQREMAISSVDSTNVNMTYPASSNSSQAVFWMLCLRNCTARVGTFDLNGLTGPQTISVPGLTPRLFLPVLVPNGVSSLGSIVNGAFMTIGASDGTNTVSSGTSDQNAVTTTNARRWQSSNDLEEYDVNGNKIFDATVSFVGESIVVNPSLNTSGVGQGAYLVIGS